MLWESITKPTTMIITGYAEQYENTYYITDDYTMYRVQVDGCEPIETETCGYLNLLTIDEFCKSTPQSDFENFYCQDDIYDIGAMFILPKFTGDIYIKKLNLETNKYFKDDSEYEYDDYITVVFLPKNTEITTDFRKFLQIMKSFQTDNFTNPFM